MKSFTTLIVSVLASLPYVYAHGFVSQVAIDGKVYQGNTPNDPKCESNIPGPEFLAHFHLYSCESNQAHR